MKRSKARRLASVIEDNCPVPNTHRRLESAHTLWHQAQAEYDNPEGFRTNLNATIQELRNVTFVLQKEKTGVPGFDQWYANWQARLRQDRTARWLVDARNQIVKQGDLETASTASAILVASYDTNQPLRFNVPPIRTNIEIAVALASTVPADLRKDGILIVDRRWEASSLPGAELLETLATCYRTLVELVAEAHSRSSVAFRQIACERIKRESRRHGSRSAPCMAALDVDRRSIVDLESGRLMRIGGTPVKRLSSPQRLIERYGAINPVDPTGKSMAEVAELLHSRALHLLTVDGYHNATVQLLRQGSIVAVNFLLIRNRADKYALWHMLAREVVDVDADAVIAINEAWVAEHDPAHPDRHAVDAPQRTEVLQTVAASAEGEQLEIFTDFSHSQDGKIVLGETKRPSTGEANFLRPIRAAWSQMQVAATAPP